MRILHIIPTLATAGAENFVVSIANEQARNHDVTILTLSAPSDTMFLKDRIAGNVRLVSLNKQRGMDLSVITHVYRSIRKISPDVINTHLRSIYYTFLPQILLRIPSFHTIHNLADRETGTSYRRLLKVLVRYFSFIPVSISQTVLESVQAFYGPRHTVLIENGIPEPHTTNKLKTTCDKIEKLKETAETKVLVNIGRVSRQKNQLMLINAFDSLVKEGHDILLLILGDFHDEAENIRQKVEALDHNRVHLLGLKPNIPDFLACSDFFCLSSIHEGLPLTLLEAMAMGTLPVCTPAGGIPDLITDGETGFLSPSFDTADYINALKRALDLPEAQRSKMQATAKKAFAKNYSIQRCASEYIQEYKQAIDNR
jgi:glycosyltransferase involved in cell wall biosynthesis